MGCSVRDGTYSLLGGGAFRVMLMTTRNWIFWGNQVTWADINISMVKLSLVSRRLVNSVLPFFGSYLWSATLTRIYDSPGHKGLCLTKQGAAMCHGDQWAPWRSCCSVVAGIPLLATVCVHLPEKWVGKPGKVSNKICIHLWGGGVAANLTSKSSSDFLGTAPADLHYY